MTNFRRQILLKMFMLLDPCLLTLSYVAAAIRIWHLTEPMPARYRPRGAGVRLDAWA